MHPEIIKNTIIKNRFLKSLSPDDFGLIRPLLTATALNEGGSLNSSKDGLSHLHFIEEGLVSVRYDGVEVAMIGQLGFVGMPALLGASDALGQQFIVHVPGMALSIAVDAFKKLSTAHPHIRDHFLRYADPLLVEIAQIGVCNGSHDIPQRVARWLVLACNNLGAYEIPVTHQKLADCLNVRRAGVTEALVALEAEKVVNATRGSVQILQPEVLESRACECQKNIIARYRRWRVKPYRHELRLEHGWHIH